MRFTDSPDGHWANIISVIFLSSLGEYTSHLRVKISPKCCSSKSIYDHFVHMHVRVGEDDFSIPSSLNKRDQTGVQSRFSSDLNGVTQKDIQTRFIFQFGYFYYRIIRRITL